MKGKCSGLSGTSRSGKKRSVKSRNKVRCMEQEVYKPHPSLIHYEAWSKHKNFKLNQAFDVTLHEPKFHLAEYSTCRHVFSSMLLYQSFRCIASTSDTFESQERTSRNKCKYILNDFFIFLDKRGVGGGGGERGLECGAFLLCQNES